MLRSLDFILKRLDKPFLFLTLCSLKMRYRPSSLSCLA